jgi:hypothetical protein
MSSIINPPVIENMELASSSRSGGSNDVQSSDDEILTTKSAGWVNDKVKEWVKQKGDEFVASTNTLFETTSVTSTNAVGRSEISAVQGV